MTAPECTFCKIIAGDAPAIVVREWIDTIAILPPEDKKTGRRGCADGHILVIPRVHVTDFTVDPVVSAVTTLRLAELAQELGTRTGLDYNEITSAGVDATQTVFHLHRHLVPRRAGDNLALPWTGRELVARELDEWAQMVRTLGRSPQGLDADVLAGDLRRRAVGLRGGAR